MNAIKLFAAAALVAAPVLSFAQTHEGVTRAQVRAELVQLQEAGYSPASDQTQYPKNIEAALARIHQGDAAARAYGGAQGGASQADARGDKADSASLYARP